MKMVATRLDFRLTVDQEINHFGEIETFSFMGRCRLCHSTLYAVKQAMGGFDVDPRGPTGSRHCYEPAVAFEHDMVGPDVPFCYQCLSDNAKDHARCLEIAKKEWKPAPAGGKAEEKC